MITTQQRPVTAAVVCERPHLIITPTALPKKGAGLDHFRRWRPSYHFIAPKNWMNDPCGPCYDSATGLYHLLYQYNPEGATWGNMSWMHAISKDLVHWTHIGQKPTLVPSMPHDKEGIFSGCLLTHGPQGQEGMMTAIYTAVSRLPIHFTKPYLWGSEKLALAVSADGGRSWVRDESSLILTGPPEELKGEVISWRDPYVASWPEMDEQLGLEKGKHLYGLISGGLKDKTPTAFLYRLPRHDLCDWTFVSTMVDIGLNFELGRSTGDMGQNWEVCNFLSLKGQQFLIMNVEGVGEDKKGRHAMWANVDLQGSQLLPKKSGLIDHGCLYAVTTFFDEPTQRRIMWGWITEDDLAESRYDQQGWSGCMSLPREAQYLTYDFVDKAILSDSHVTSSFNVVDQGDSLLLQTLGWRPVAETKRLREGAQHFSLQTPAAGRLPLRSQNIELLLGFMVGVAAPGQAEVGLLLSHNATHSHYTKVIYSDSHIHVVRLHSTKDVDVVTATVTAPLVLLPFADGSREAVNIHLFLDNSVLEVFVNGRVALTTRIYCDDAEATHISLLNSDPDHATFSQVEAWTNLQAAMIDPSNGGEPSKL